MKKIISILMALLMLALSAAAVTAAEESPFSDVKTSRWSYGAVKYAYENGLMDGVGSSRFDPAGTMTRAMVVTVLWRTEDKPSVEFRPDFTDVKAGKYYSDAVIWAKDNEIVNGVAEGKFDPSGKITREQLATMLYRYADFKGLDVRTNVDLRRFPDSGRVHSYAKTALTWTVEKGLVTGVKSGNATLLDPRGNATREQFATILMRFRTADLTYPLEYNNPVLRSKYTERTHPPVTDADFYVAPDGDDGGPGTLDKPFASFGRAVEAVRELKKTKTSGGITVAFKAGEYGPLELTLTPEDAGTAECPVTYCDYGDGDVIFRNGLKIPLSDFEPIGSDEAYLFPENSVNKIKKVNVAEKYGFSDINASSELYSSTKRYDAARFPNKSKPVVNTYLIAMYNTVEGSHRDIKLFPIIARRVEKYHTWDNVKVIGPLGYEWYTDTLDVESFDPESAILHFKEDSLMGIYDTYQYRGFLFHNVSEELDNEGEYWIDPDTSTIYVYDPDSDFTVSTHGTFLTVNGADHVTVSGMRFLCTTGGGFSVSASDFTVDRCVFFGFGSRSGSSINGYRNRVTNCEFSQIAGAGITLSGGDSTHLIPGENVIDNCLIEDSSQIYRSAAVPVGLYGVGNTVSHCEIRRTPYIAIMYGGVNNVIEYCYFSECVMEGSDLGILYNGRSHVSRGNVIRHNCLDGTGNLAFGMYLDDGLDGQIIYGNLTFNCYSRAIFSTGGRENYLCDNICIVNGHISNPEAECGVECAEKYYAAALEGTVLGTYAGRHSTLFNKPEEGEDGYEEWSAAFPDLYTMIPGYDDLEDPRTEVCPTGCTVERNRNIGYCVTETGDGVKKFGTVDVKDEYDFTLKENPFFVNPTLGDYTIREGADVYDVEFEKIGRY